MSLAITKSTNLIRTSTPVQHTMSTFNSDANQVISDTSSSFNAYRTAKACSKHQ